MSKIVGRSCAEDHYIKERLLKKPKIKRAVGGDVKWLKFKLFPKGF